MDVDANLTMAHDQPHRSTGAVLNEETNIPCIDDAALAD